MRSPNPAETKGVPSHCVRRHARSHVLRVGLFNLSRGTSSERVFVPSLTTEFQVSFSSADYLTFIQLLSAELSITLSPVELRKTKLPGVSKFYESHLRICFRDHEFAFCAAKDYSPDDLFSIAVHAHSISVSLRSRSSNVPGNSAVFHCPLCITTLHNMFMMMQTCRLFCRPPLSFAATAQNGIRSQTEPLLGNAMQKFLPRKRYCSTAVV